MKDDQLQDLQRRFARAIAPPGGKARLIDTHNRAEGIWAPIEQVIGRSFFVDVRPEILPVDWDAPQDKPSNGFEVWASAVREAGVPLVVLASGQPGHRHGFAVVSEGPLRDRLERLAKGFGLDVRRSIRPPLTPHRRGLPCQILGDTTKALSILEEADPLKKAARIRERVAWKIRDLRPEWRILITTGELKGRYEKPGGGFDRSAADAGLALALVQRDWSFEEFRHAVFDHPTWAGSAKARERLEKEGLEAALDYLAATWRSAEGRARERPAIGGRHEVYEELGRWLAAVEAASFDARTRYTDIAVARETHRQAVKQGTMVPALGTRDLADGTGISNRKVVSASLQRLNRFMTLHTAGRGPHAARYRLVFPSADARHDSASTSPGSTGGCEECGVITGLPHGHPAFRERGRGGQRALGRSAHEMLLGFCECGFRTVEEAMAVRHVPKTTAYRAIRRLLDAGVLEPAGSTYRRRQNVDWDAVSAEFGTDKKAADQRARHGRERQARGLSLLHHHLRERGLSLDHWFEPKDSRRVVDTATGEVIEVTEAVARVAARQGHNQAIEGENAVPMGSPTRTVLADEDDETPPEPKDHNLMTTSNVCAGTKNGGSVVVKVLGPEDDVDEIVMDTWEREAVSQRGAA